MSASLPWADIEMPNAALAPFQRLIGRWFTTGHHPHLPGVTLHGQATFEWIEGGAFVRMHVATAEPGIPTGVAVFGTDSDAGTTFMLYFDERGVSRKCDVAFHEHGWRWWRDDPRFAQRFTITIADDDRTMLSKGEMRREGGDWEPDLELTYRRER